MIPAIMSGGRTMSQITIRGHGLLPGDRVRLSSDTNRVRRVVAGIGETESLTSFRTLIYLRPSRGFAKHRRRVKAHGNS